jgi:hypothetical protein
MFWLDIYLIMTKSDTWACMEMFRNIWTKEQLAYVPVHRVPQLDLFLRKKRRWFAWRGTA